MCRSVTGVPELMHSDGPGKAEGLAVELRELENMEINVKKPEGQESEQCFHLLLLKS